MTPGEKKEQARLDVTGLTVGGIGRCAESLLAPENLKNVTPDDLARLNQIYDALHIIQQRVACGIDVVAENARFEERLKKRFGVTELKP
jgi:hypothetical protein